MRYYAELCEIIWIDWDGSRYMQIDAHWCQLMQNDACKYTVLQRYFKYEMALSNSKWQQS